MAYDTWGGSWGSSWGLSWTRSGVIPPVIVDTGGSGHRGSGRRRRDINDDPQAFAELLREWRAKKESRKHIVVAPAPGMAQGDSEGARIETHRSGALVSPQEGDQAEELLDQIRRIEAAYDRSMVVYEAALAKVEKTQKAAKAKETAIRQAALKQEELARQQALQLAIEWELARLAYEDFLEEEDEIMLLS